MKTHQKIVAGTGRERTLAAEIYFCGLFQDSGEQTT